MTKMRMEAFSDGVIAIIITIMVLELRPPAGAGLSELAPLVPAFLSYALSFVFLGIYWSNHHHLLQAIKNVDGRVLWANLHLLFWLSFVPFTTAWMGKHWNAAWPVVLYGAALLMASVAYYILVHVLIALHGTDSLLAVALGKDFKGRISMVIYSIAILVVFVRPWAACSLYVLVAIMWLVPDRRLERTLGG